MNDSAGRDVCAKVLALFIRNGIPPEPEVVSALRLEATEARCAILEKREEAREASFTGGGRFDAAYWARVLEASDSPFRRQIDVAMAAPKNYDEWSPSPEDWVKLAISLAIKHEPDFKFVPPQPSVGEERAWVRDMAMEQVLRVEPRPSLEVASKLAAKSLDAGIKNGSYNADIKIGSAGHIKTGFSKRQAARERLDDETSTMQPRVLPPSLKGWVDARRHFASLVTACLRLTDWPDVAHRHDRGGAGNTSDTSWAPRLHMGK